MIFISRQSIVTIVWYIRIAQLHRLGAKAQTICLFRVLVYELLRTSMYAFNAFF